MCDPLTLVMGAMSAIGTISSSRAQADMEKRQATIERQTSTENARRSRAQYEALKQDQEAAFLKGNVTLEGTPADVLMKTAADAELEALSILHGGELQAQSHEIQAKNIKKSGMFTAAGQLIGGMKPSAGKSGGSKLLGGTRTVGATVSTSTPWKNYPDFVGP